MRNLVPLCLIFFLALAACSPEPTPQILVSTSTPNFTCETLVETTIQSLDTVCQQVGRNEACYGNRLIDVDLEGADTSSFDSPGDTLPIVNLNRINLSPFDESTGNWGFALMQVQANLPDTLPGQNVTFLLYGGTELSPQGEVAGLEAFYVRTGIGNLSTCNNIPEDGLIIQSPEGDVAVEFSLNGVIFELGSTAYITAEANAEMAIRLLEGQAIVSSLGETQTILAGQESFIPLNAEALANGVPTIPQAYDKSALELLPLAPLPRSIEISLATDSRVEAPTAIIPSTQMPTNTAENPPENSQANPIFIPELASLNNPNAAILSDAINSATATIIYNFEASAGQEIFLDSHSNEGEVTWTLIAPDTREIVTQAWLGIDYGPYVLEQSGFYTIEIKLSRGNAGRYEIQLWDVPKPSTSEIRIIEAIPANQDGIVSGEIVSVGASQIFTFSAGAGQRIFVDSHSETNDIYWSLLAPDGTVLLSQQWAGSDFGPYQLPTRGVYTLRYWGYLDALGSFQFQLWNVQTPQTSTISLVTSPNTRSLAAANTSRDGLVSGNISTPGQSYLYTFSAGANTNIIVDSQIEGGDLYFNITSPSGNLIMSQNWLGADSQVLNLPERGTYTIEVFGYLDNLGAYQFQVLQAP